MKKLNLLTVLMFALSTAVFLAQLKFHTYGFSGGA
jgi:hypothetical protein